jgi:hypothetical protein
MPRSVRDKDLSQLNGRRFLTTERPVAIAAEGRLVGLSNIETYVSPAPNERDRASQTVDASSGVIRIGRPSCGQSACSPP